jgi:hypothetical protein
MVHIIITLGRASKRKGSPREWQPDLNAVWTEMIPGADPKKAPDSEKETGA